MNQRLVRLPQVKAMVGLGRSSIYEKIKRGEFPKQIKLGRSSGWLEAEIQAGISEQFQARRPEPLGSLECHRASR
ncbi:MAG: putative transcriptional regulator [Candidatus Accumulibacter appositus]|uniref:Putative transcriptional regulator n=1 Tax=Candidatus Accumulibacter appositus TaxID=1454003 RepID=A0A011Q1G7_9PROT|nr:AlpA family transcriptional regulator [Accumulibacter sp.]EXI82985.1 MAG: putative transcriptional regulator [Candidatus Accumulibacter appositus]HRF06463.1 AlpA family transcriptional regulator [Accumulibacter sp.]